MYWNLSTKGVTIQKFKLDTYQQNESQLSLLEYQPKHLNEYILNC